MFYKAKSFIRKAEWHKIQIERLPWSFRWQYAIVHVDLATVYGKRLVNVFNTLYQCMYTMKIETGEHFTLVIIKNQVSFCWSRWITPEPGSCQPKLASQLQLQVGLRRAVLPCRIDVCGYTTGDTQTAIIRDRTVEINLRRSRVLVKAIWQVQKSCFIVATAFVANLRPTPLGECRKCFHDSYELCSWTWFWFTASLAENQNGTFWLGGKICQAHWYTPCAHFIWHRYEEVLLLPTTAYCTHWNSHIMIL